MDEKKYFELIRNMSDEIFHESKAMTLILSSEGKIVFSNDSFLKNTGYKKEEIKGKDFFSLFIKTDEKVAEIFGKIISVGGEKQNINHILRKDGTPILMLWDNYAIKDGEGGIAGTISFGQDISFRSDYSGDIKKINETVLAFSNDALENIKKLTELALNVSGADTVLYNKVEKGIVSVLYGSGPLSDSSPREGSLAGTLCKVLLESGKNDLEKELTPNDSFKEALCYEKYYGALVFRKEEKAGTLCFFFKDGKIRVKKQRLGIIARLIGSQEERLSFYREIKSERDRYSSLFDRMPYLVYYLRIKPQKELLYINPAAEKITGYTLEEGYSGIENVFNKLIHPEDRAKYFEFINSGNAISQSLKIRWIKKDGTVIWTDRLLVAIKNEQGDVVAVQGFVRDITQEINYHNELNSFIRTLTLISSIDSIFIKKQGFEIYKDLMEYLREAAGSEYGFLGFLNEAGDIETKYITEKVYGECKLGDEIAHSAYADSDSVWARALKEGKIYVLNLREGKVPAGHVAIRNAVAVPVKTGNNILGVILLANRSGGYSEDMVGLVEKISKHISDRIYQLLENEKLKKREARMMEERLMAQKIESLGMLASGIAHDFNNLLLGLSANISYLKEKIKVPELEKVIEDAGIYIDSAARLARQLIVFSKGGKPLLEETSAADFLKSAVSFPLRGARCSSEIKFDEGLWDFSVDRGQISQVVANIVLNSLQAVSKNSYPALKIRVENYRHGGDGILPAGSYIKMSFSDNGKGIKKENLKRLFEPFFTTKEKGTGLGLYMSYSIIKNHGGNISVSSKEGEGSVFTVFLPALAHKAVEQKQTVPVVLSEKLRILIVDDEEIILNSMKRLVGAIGMEVLTAGSSAAAFEAAKNNKVDIAFIDLTLRGDMGGEEINAGLKKINPAIYTVVSSGYSDDAVMSEYKRYGFDNIMPKPYKIQDINRIAAEYYKKKTA